MKSNRLKFRELSLEDANDLFRIYSNEVAMQYRKTEALKSLEDAKEMIYRAQETQKSNYEWRFAIIEQESKKLIGTFMIQPLNGKAIIGYSLDIAFWNKGYGTEVVSFIIDYAQSKGFYQLEAWVQKENITSKKVLLKNNFSLISQTLYPDSDYFVFRLM